MTMVTPTHDEIQGLADSWLNGNTNFVADEICGRSPADAAFIVGNIVQGWMHHGMTGDVNRLMRAILRRIED
jgi:hypothetical protein